MPLEKAHRSLAARLSGAAGVLAALFLGWAVWPAPAGADPALYASASTDGENVFFTTPEKLVPGDTDNKRDVYERFYNSEPGIESYVTREVSTGPAGGNDAYDVTFNGTSTDGLRVLFSTAESLVAEDLDLSIDIYMRDLQTGATTLVSKADSSCAVPSCGNAADPASFDSVSSDGTRVVFSTEEVLSGGDADAVDDVYLRDLEGGGETTLVSEAAAACSVPNCGDGAFPAFFAASSVDGLAIAFSSGEPLSDEDTKPNDEDIYWRDVEAATTNLVSKEGTCPAGLGPGECTPIFGGISGDGSHVFYETGERVAVAQDTDKRQDVYGWSGGAPALLSTGPLGGNGELNSTYQGTVADGSAVFFKTDEAVAAPDADGGEDIYRRSGSTTVLVSTGPGDADAGAPADFEKASADGSAAILATAEPLTGDDTDSSRDVYLRDIGGGSTVLLSKPGSGCAGSCGAGAVEAGFAGASSDGSVTFFKTAESMVSADADASADIYERSGAETTLVSTGPMAKNGASSPHLEDVSSDGGHALFTTDERLTIDDLDTEIDVYDRGPAGTLLVSTRNPDELVLGPAVPLLTGTSPISPNVSTEPRVTGQADFGTSIKVYATPDCSGAPVATGTAAQLEAPGIAVKVGLGSTTTFHATATLLNDTSACSTSAVTYKQVTETGGEGGGGGGGGGTGSGSGGGSTGSQPGSGGGGNVGAAQPLTPRTRITFAPASKTRLRRPTFQFVDSTGQQGTRFMCAVDRGRWRSCASPTKLKKLGRGRHLFKVKGVNSGLSESAAATRAFKVVAR